MQYCMTNGERSQIDSVLTVSIDATISVESRKKESFTSSNGPEAGRVPWA